MYVTHTHTHTHISLLGNCLSLKLCKEKNLTGVNYWREGQTKLVERMNFKFILNKIDFPNALLISKWIPTHSLISCS